MLDLEHSCLGCAGMAFGQLFSGSLGNYSDQFQQQANRTGHEQRADEGNHHREPGFPAFQRFEHDGES